jgi:hypothetical protein
MSNEFVEAMSQRIEVAQAKNASAANMKKLHALRAMCANETFAQLLRDSDVSAERLNRAMYASEKVIKFAFNAVRKTVDFADVNENAFAAFKTAMQLHAAKLDMTKRDAEASISKAVKASDDHAAHVFQRNVILSDDTLAAQSQQVVDMLKTLNILHSDAARATRYTITRNALADALCKALNI